MEVEDLLAIPPKRDQMLEVKQVKHWLYLRHDDSSATWDLCQEPATI